MVGCINSTTNILTASRTLMTSNNLLQMYSMFMTLTRRISTTVLLLKMPKAFVRILVAQKQITML